MQKVVEQCVLFFQGGANLSHRAKGKQLAELRVYNQVSQLLLSVQSNSYDHVSFSCAAMDLHFLYLPSGQIQKAKELPTRTPSLSHTGNHFAAEFREPLEGL